MKLKSGSDFWISNLMMKSDSESRIWIWNPKTLIWIQHLKLNSDSEIWTWHLKSVIGIWDLNLKSESEVLILDLQWVFVRFLSVRTRFKTRTRNHTYVQRYENVSYYCHYYSVPCSSNIVRCIFKYYTRIYCFHTAFYVFDHLFWIQCLMFWYVHIGKLCKIHAYSKHKRWNKSSNACLRIVDSGFEAYLRGLDWGHTGAWDRRLKVT